MKILMICLGNICRSPLAEGILQAKTRQENLNWTIDSAAMGSWHVGKSPDSRARAIAKKHGLSIDDQRARLFTAKDFDQFDLILAMDQNNYNDITQMASTDEQRKKVRRILELTNDKEENVPDPYYDDNGFEHVYQLLDRACTQLIEQLKP